jgi:hypothetical protein
MRFQVGSKFEYGGQMFYIVSYSHGIDVCLVSWVKSVQVHEWTGSVHSNATDEDIRSILDSYITFQVMYS